MKTLLRVTWPYMLACAVGVVGSVLYGDSMTAALVAGLLCAGIVAMLLWAARQ